MISLYGYIQVLFYFSLPAIMALGVAGLWQLFPGGWDILAALYTTIACFFGNAAYLLAMCNRFGLQKNYSLALCVLLSFLVNTFCIYMHYIGWGYATGRLHDPDSSTELILCLERLISSGILGIGSIVLLFIKFEI